MKKSYFSREYYVIIVYLFKKTIFLLKSFFHPPSIVSQCLSPIIILFFHHSGLFRLLEKKINVITSVSEFAFCPKIKFLHVKDPAKGPEQAIGRNINAYIFLTIGDTSINVYNERKLRVSRFWKFKNFSFFDAFLYPKRYLNENMGFWGFEVGIQIFS